MSANLFKAIALAAAASTATANLEWTVYEMDHDWEFRYKNDCSVEIYKKTEGNKILVFNSDNQLLSTGYGSVDEKVIMKAGNIVHYPFKKTSSTGMTCDEIVVDADNKVSIKGQIQYSDSSSAFLMPSATNSTGIDYTAQFYAIDDRRFGFEAEAEGVNSDANGTNYLSMKYGSDDFEEFYGMGLQYTDWNFKGKKMPLITAEGGVGRGLQPITSALNIFSNGGGGNDVNSYAPAAQYITNRQRGMIFDNLKIGYADFEDPNYSELLYWHENKITGQMFWGSDYLDLAQTISKTVGTMRPLPRWVMEGAIVGIVNGEEYVREQYAKMKALELPMVGIWMQDWVGQHDFPEGTRLLWNWQLNRDWYPNWDEMVDEWNADGVKPFIYINPFVSDLSEFDVDLRQDQFKIGNENGYFIKNSDGETYMMKSISINFAMVDFTNPDAFTWYKEIIKQNLVLEGRAGGWMHDFGEYLPFDSVMFDGSDPYEYHNQYPLDWSRCLYEALSEVEGGEDLIPFMRAGTGTSPANTRLFWMGDQLVTYDHWDGLHSALMGLMNGGLSGFTLGHSDIGGYTASKNIIKSYLRNKELLLRWIEMNTFSDVIMRSHPSNLPDDCYQIWDEEDSILFLKDFVEIHMRLADYKMKLMEDAYNLGSPFTRALMVSFPEDKRARLTHDEFMLGENLLMAPIFHEGKTQRDVYLPGPARWTHIFTGDVYETETGIVLENFDCPIGTPAVFTRDTDYFRMTALFAADGHQLAEVFVQ